MAVTQNQRIFDLAYGAGMNLSAITQIINAQQSAKKEALSTELQIAEVLANVNEGPSGQVVGGAAGSESQSGITAQLFGGLRQAALPSRPARSNADYLGIGTATDKLFIAATKIQQVVAVPVQPSI